MGWNIKNAMTETFLGRCPERYLMLRYEDFVEQPQEMVRRILSLLGEESSPLPFVAEREVQLTRSHTISGNPSRFRTGIVEIQSDEEWRTRMRVLDKAVVTVLTWPLLLKYGYMGRVETTRPVPSKPQENKR
jgi:hypothetical protein